MDKILFEKLEKLKNSCTIKDNYKCSKCRDLGYILVKTKEGESAYPCECLSEKRAMENLAKCGLSDVFKTKTFKNYECTTTVQKTAKYIALNYCKNNFKNNESIIICGRPGSGKTHLAIAVMLNLIKQGISCKYVEYNSMMIALKQSIMDSTNHTIEMEKLLSPRVLFVDDFLKGRVNESDVSYIFRLVNSRYLQGKQFIISTEKTMDDILKWDEAVGSRLVEMAQQNIIIFGKETANYRLKK